jgi:IS1 family transposase
VQDTADELIGLIKKRGKQPTEDEKATFFSDGNTQYTHALLEDFDEKTINYGQIIKQREKGRVVGKTRTIVLGTIDGTIDTVHIERYNLTVRHGISRLVRKSICFSKCKEMLDDHLDVYQCYINLIRPHSTLTMKTEEGHKNIEQTPCMAEGITDHIWTWEEFLMFKGGVNP